MFRTISTRASASIAAAILAAASLSGSLEAQESSTRTTEVDIAKLTCRSLLQATGDERDYVVIYVHGYISGTKQETTADLSKLAASTDAAIDYCIDHPDASVLDAFKKTSN